VVAQSLAWQVVAILVRQDLDACGPSTDRARFLDGDDERWFGRMEQALGHQRGAE